MRIIPIAILVAALTLSATHSNAIDLLPGQSIGIDLGATSPKNKFNQWDPSNPGTPADGILSIVKDTTGATIPGMEVHFGGIGAASIMAVEGVPYYIPAGFDASNIEDAVTGYNLTMTFTGLTPGQAFSLSLVSYSSGTNVNFGTEFFWGTQSRLTDNTSITGGALAYFQDIYPDANGQILISAYSRNSPFGSSWSGVNAALLTAQTIPEPSFSTFMLVGIAGLAFAHRHRAARLRAKPHCLLSEPLAI